MNQTSCPPEVPARALRLTVQRQMAASPSVLFQAWTHRFDDWFAAPGTMLTRTDVDTAFFFEVREDGQRYPHYGRFLRIEPEQLLEFTWLTCATRGTETVVAVELTPHADGTHLTLTHAGFPDEESREQHETAWNSILAQLDQKTSSWPSSVQ